ncbi:hypothetical protein Tco_1184843 [Tanacetum coccineum]
MENNKIIDGTITTLKQELKQKESKFLTDFSNLKHLNDKLENKLHSQDQSIQTVHMMLNPTQVYDQKTKTALGAQNPFHLRQAKRAQPALYDGKELLKTHHVPVNVSSSEEELELAEITRNKLHAKMNDSACVEKRVNITPLNYSKENFMETFAPQTQLTPETFWKKKPVTSSNAPSFDSLFVIGKLNEQIQSRGNTIHELKEKISRLIEKNSDADPTLDLKALVSQNKDLTAKLNALHDLNERFRAENAKVKQHYKELLYRSFLVIWTQAAQKHMMEIASRSRFHEKVLSQDFDMALGASVRVLLLYLPVSLQRSIFVDLDLELPSESTHASFRDLVGVDPFYRSRWHEPYTHLCG